MLKKIFKWFVLISVVIFLYIKFVLRGNNKFTVYHYHGIWLPAGTKNIRFTIYPEIPRIRDDRARNYCEMSKNDYLVLLRKQKYTHAYMKDPNTDSLLFEVDESQYSNIPDSLINRFSVSFKCESSTGDFRIIEGKLIDSNTVEVMLYTDWN